MLMKTLALIPCYNHQRYLPNVVNEIKKYCKDILIVDDGSTDGSYNVIKNIDGAAVIRHDTNKGKGAALKTGFKYAIKQGYDSVLTIDADGQHKAFDIPNFLKKSENYSIIIGSRMHNVRNMPLRRILANSLSSFLISLKIGQKISDSQSGFRLIKTDVLKKVKLKSNDYQMETELILKAAKKGYKIGYVPIETIYGKEVSHINPFTVSYRFFKTLLKS